MTRFTTHSAACGILADILAQRLRVSCAEAAFAAGLLHDLGHILIAVGLPAQHEKILKLRLADGLDGVESENEVLGFAHPELSAEGLEHWKLPQPVRTAALFHHSSAQDQSAERGEIPLSRVIEAANNYLNSTSISIFATGGADSADPTLLESLVPDEDRRSAILTEFRGEFDLMLQFFR
jgi:HD-like signal output (HDOD) protein